MPRIPLIQVNPAQNLGQPALASAPRSQAFGQLAKSAAQFEEIATKQAERDAALDGMEKLADFNLRMKQRQNELQTQVKTPDGFTSVALEEFDKQAQALVDGVDNPRVQSFLDQRLLASRDAFGNEAMGWEAATQVNLRQQKTVDVIDKLANTVNSSPARFDQVAGDLEAYISAVGLPVDDAEKLRSMGKRTLARSAVQGQLETNPGGVLSQLQSGKWDNYLDADAKAGLVNAAQSEIKRRQSEARAQASMARQEALMGYSQWKQDNLSSITATGKPVPPPFSPETMKALLKPAQYENDMRMLARANAIYQATGDLGTKSEAEILATVKALEPPGGQAGDAEARQIYQAAQARMKTVMTERKADPATAARSAIPAVQWAWESWGKNPKDDGNLRVALKRSLAAQKSMGIPEDQQKPLPAPIARLISDDIRNAPPDKAADTLASWRARLGPYWGQAFSQLAPNMDTHATMASTLDDPNMAAILLETSRSADGKGNLKAVRDLFGITETGTDSIKLRLSQNQDFMDMTNALAAQSKGVKVALDIQASAEALALGLMSRQGLSKDEAVNAVVGEFITKKYQFARINNRPIAVPRRYMPDEVETGAARAMRTIRPDGIDLPGKNRGATDEATREAYISAIRRDGYWATVKGEKGLELRVGDAPVTRYGRRIVYTFEQLQDLSKADVRTDPTADFLGGRLPGEY